MPSPTEITVAQPSRIIGLPNAPFVIDVRAEEEFRSDPKFIPTAQHLIFGDKSRPCLCEKPHIAIKRCVIKAMLRYNL